MRALADRQRGPKGERARGEIEAKRTHQAVRLARRPGTMRLSWPGGPIMGSGDGMKRGLISGAANPRVVPAPGPTSD